MQHVGKFTIIHWPWELCRRIGYAQQVENGYVQVNFSGFNQPSMLKTDQDMLDAAKSLPTKDLQYILEHGEPVSDIDTFKKPKNQRNHFEKVRLCRKCIADVTRHRNCYISDAPYQSLRTASCITCDLPNLVDHTDPT